MMSLGQTFWFKLTSLAFILTVSMGLSACSISPPQNNDEDLPAGGEKFSTREYVPVKDERLVREDFAFPSQPPSLVAGKSVYSQNCASCHAANFWQQKGAQTKLAYTTPIDTYLMLTTGEAPEVQGKSHERPQILPSQHPAFQDKLSRDERWAALFYVRYLAGAGDFAYKSRSGKPLSVASIYGANCAVCHGKEGYGNGPLHTGHPSSHELAAGKVHGGLFIPPPANFHDYRRLYNRTDAQLVKYLREGIYPSGMPAWLGNVDKDNDFVFDEPMLLKLVRHVRTFAYKNDLPEEDALVVTPPLGLPQMSEASAEQPPSKNSIEHEG
ncbi:MAG: c-type cytochrome [Vampirovibrionales bacterium]|nr:c-type cytochrome [Vampirovibrionales bacterium]